jgi:hypothetical protein
MDDQEVSWDEDMAWTQDMNKDWDDDMAWDEDMNMDLDENMAWTQDMNKDWDDDMAWDEDMNMDLDEDMTWDQEIDMDWDCEMEKWAKTCSEFDPNAPSDCEIVYEHDPCGASSCVIWDEYGPSDCLEGLQDPDFWAAIKDLEVWDESNQLTKAYWDEYHAAVNGGEEGADGADEEAWNEDDYDYDYEEDVWEDFDYYDDWEDYDDECDWEAGAYWEEPCASFDPEAGEDCYVYYTAPVCGMAPSCWIEENGEWDDCLWMLADKETWDVLSQSGGFTTEEMAET